MDQLMNASELMRTMQEEIAGVKDGTLSESKARIVASYRRAEIQLIGHAIQWTRMVRSGNSKLSGGGVIDMPLLTSREPNGEPKT